MNWIDMPSMRALRLLGVAVLVAVLAVSSTAAGEGRGREAALEAQALQKDLMRLKPGEAAARLRAFAERHGIDLNALPEPSDEPGRGVKPASGLGRALRARIGRKRGAGTLVAELRTLE